MAFRYCTLLKTPLFVTLLVWTLSSAVLSIDSVHYCPENGQTERIELTSSTQLRTVFEEGDGNYRQNQNCRWILDAGFDINKRIYVTVVESDLQWVPPNTDCKLYDYIELLDGEENDSPLVLRWCEGSTPTTVISKSNLLYVSFVSDDIHLTKNKGVTLKIDVFSVDSTSGSCPPSWIAPQTTSTSCFSIKTQAKTWKQAQEFCSYDQSNLVTLNDASEATYVLTEAKQTLTSSGYSSVWIGLNDILKEGEFVWVDGTQVLNSFSLSKVPSRSQKYKDCMMADVDSGLWSEEHCDRPEAQSSSKYPFVCERKRDGTTVPQESPPVEAITYYCQPDGKILYISNAESARIQTREQDTSTYGKNLNCRWIINSGLDPDKRIHVSVTDSKLQWTPSDSICFGYDHVEIRNGPDETSPLLTTFCGNMNPYTVISSSNVLFISFTSGDRQVYNLPGVTLDFSFFSVAPSRQECPPGWVSDSPNGKYCYNVKTHAQTWVEAQQYCKNDQANLVSLETEEEAKFVLDYAVQTLSPLPYTKLWIGLDDIADEGKLVWIDGIKSTINPRFGDSYTTSLYEDCVVVRLSDRKWMEAFCTTGEVQTTTKYPFVCKRKRDGSTTLFKIPSAKAEKEGSKGTLAPKPLIIMGVIAAILVLVLLGGFIVYRIKKKSTTRSGGYTSPSHHANPASSLPSLAASAPAEPAADEQPPPYSEVTEPTKMTPV